MPGLSLIVRCSLNRLLIINIEWNCHSGSDILFLRVMRPVCVPDSWLHRFADASVEALFSLDLLLGCPLCTQFFFDRLEPSFKEFFVFGSQSLVSFSSSLSLGLGVFFLR